MATNQLINGMNEEKINICSRYQYLSTCVKWLYTYFTIMQPHLKCLKEPVTKGGEKKKKLT